MKTTTINLNSLDHNQLNQLVKNLTDYRNSTQELTESYDSDIEVVNKFISNLKPSTKELADLHTSIVGEYYRLAFMPLDFSEKDFIKIPLPEANSEWSISAWKWAATFVENNKDAYIAHNKSFNPLFVYINCTQ